MMSEQQRMEQVPEEQAKPYQEMPFDVTPTIVLREEKYGAGFPKGEQGEERNGFSFYELRENPKTKTLELFYITSRINDAPILEAVTETQQNIWEKKRIIARPARFLWNEESAQWKIVED